MNATVDVTLSAIDADIRGHEDQRDTLATQADSGVMAMVEMRRDLPIRAAVINAMNHAIEDCLRVLGN